MEKMEITFQLCQESNEPFSKPDHIAQFKFDGRRVAVIKEGDKVTFWGRDPIDENTFPELLEAYKKIPGNFIVDTEFAVFDKNGMRTDFPSLQSRSKTRDKFKIKLLAKQMPATSIIFDVLEFNGQDLRNEEYQDRRDLLTSNFQEIPGRVKIAEEFKDPMEAWAIAEKNKLEGIVIKDIHSVYSGKRTNDWIKIKRKEIITKVFTGYEVSNAGITLYNPEGFRVAVHGDQHREVKAKLDQKGFVVVKVRGMAGTTSNGKIREIVFVELDEKD